MERILYHERILCSITNDQYKKDPFSHKGSPDCNGSFVMRGPFVIEEILYGLEDPLQIQGIV